MLSTDQITNYTRNGYLLIHDMFTADETERLRASLPELLAERGERTVLEKGGQIVRSVYAVHRQGGLFACLARHPRLLLPSRQLLRSEVYVYQSKVNAKAAFAGDSWEWHQDYVYWLKEDGMPEPRVLTAAVFLDDVTEFNGPMVVIPGSHLGGVLDFEQLQGRPAGYEDKPGWIANLTASLKYTIGRDTVTRLAREHGLASLKGRAGSVLFFDGNLAHASSPNISPFDRTLALFTYNAVDNAPPAAALHRPDFIVSREVAPVTALADDVLLRESAKRG